MTCDHFQQNAIPERYLRGQLTDSERDEFEAHFFSCDPCYTELEAMRLAGADLRQRPREQVLLPQTKSSSWWSWWWAAPVAAAAAYAMFLAVSPSFLAPQPAPRQHEIAQTAPAKPTAAEEPQLLALAKFDPPGYGETHMRGAAAGPSGPRFVEAMRTYQAGDFRQASSLLEPLLASDQTRSPQILFYAAGCRLLNGDASGAEQGATRLIAMGETPYLEEAYWMRAKARFALRNLEAARDDLGKLAALKGDWETKAKQLLDRSLEIH